MPENTKVECCNKKIKEAVCIDTKRIYDSCVSKDCMEDLRVTFSCEAQRLIDNAITVKCRDCTVESVCIDVEEVPFNRGFYGVDITFYFKLIFDVYMEHCSTPKVVEGYTSFDKKCILYGSDGDVKIFTSNQIAEETNCPEAPQYSNPTAKIQLVDPVVLATDIIKRCDCRVSAVPSFPRAIMKSLEVGTTSADSAIGGRYDKAVLVTLGLFSIVQMERDVQMLIPAYDYCIPDKECCCNTDNPCETFNNIDFPVNEFFPREQPSYNNPCSND